MTSGANAVQLRVLGPLEACIRGESVTLGGAKQRAVLAVLLLRAGEVVSVERLVEEVWGDEPPPSAAHTLESYVSRLRQLFNGHGPRVLRRGSGYVLELGEAELDARTFVELHEQACLAAAEEDHGRVVRLTTAALAVWRGPALADVALASAGRAEAERLEELRLRTHEIRFDAQLELGRHAEAVGELQSLVGQNPYRERFVAQLMLALYRSGRHAEALEVYEQTRRRLDDDLGLQPSTDLQQLSGQIVRQDPTLRQPASRAVGFTRPSPARRTRRAAALVATGVAVASALALTASGGAAVRERISPSSKKLALILPSLDRLGVAAEGLSAAADSSEALYTPDIQTAFVDPNAPGPDVAAAAARIETAGVGLVVALGDGPGARALAGVVERLPETRFVFIDASVDELSLEGVPNAAAIRFSDEDVFDLAGYASGRVPTMDGTKKRIDLVSIVAGEPTRDTSRLIAGFRRGVRASGRRVRVRIDYTHELRDKTACERVANRQIDAGSDVVVALAGKCGLGALAVARFRGVWGVGALDDGVQPTDDLLVGSEKEWTTATLWAIKRLVDGSLPMGRDTVLGLEDDYAVAMWWSNRMPEHLESAMIERCSEIRGRRHQDV